MDSGHTERTFIQPSAHRGGPPQKRLTLAQAEEEAPDTQTSLPTPRMTNGGTSFLHCCFVATPGPSITSSADL